MLHDVIHFADSEMFINFFLFLKIPLNHSNFDNTLNSTIDTSGIGANSTKIDESVADDVDNGDADAESTTKDEITEIVQDDEATPDAVEVSRI